MKRPFILMNRRNLLTLATALLAMQLNAQMTRYEQTLPGKGSKCQMNGTSSIHDWKMETPIIAGSFEVDPKVSFDTAKATLEGAADGKVAAAADVRIPVRTLKSYNAKMDEVYKQHMDEAKFKNITYKLKELTVKKGDRAAGSPFELVSKGDLTIHGETKAVEMPVKIASAPDNMLKIMGTTKLKMSEYGVKPPNPTIPGVGSITTGDEVTIEFEWFVVKK
jgi:polyisoprenoid-binding protein YceI